jgi:hypothetical protein
MMKNRIHIGLLTVILTSPCVAGENSEYVDSHVIDHFSTTTQRVPVTQTECTVNRVPIYAQSRQPSSPNFGEIVVGAAIGSAVGNAISDKDGVGTLGGIVGAHTAMKNQASEQRVIVGYENVEDCKPVTSYRSESIQSYSHSIIEFQVDGRTHRLRFQRY